MARIGHQEDRLDLTVELLVHGGHLELKLEVRHSPEAAHNHIRTDLTGEVHGQSLEGLDDDFS